MIRDLLLDLAVAVAVARTEGSKQDNFKAPVAVGVRHATEMLFAQRSQRKVNVAASMTLSLSLASRQLDYSAKLADGYDLARLAPSIRMAKWWPQRSAGTQTVATASLR